MHVQYFYKKNVLSINENNITFPDIIKECIETKDGFIILIGFLKEKQRNLFFINKDGSTKWQIESIVPNSDSSRFSPFTGVFFQPDGHIQAYNYDGYLCDIDSRNGTLLTCKFVR